MVNINGGGLSVNGALGIPLVFTDSSKAIPAIVLRSGSNLFARSGELLGIGTTANEFFSFTTAGVTLGSGETFGWSSSFPDAAGADVALLRDGTGIIAQKVGNADQTHRWYSSNAAYAQIQSLSESHTLAAAATSDTTIQAPAGSIVVGVTIRVTTLITGCATLDVGVAGATTRYGTGIALAATTTNVSPGTTNPTIYAAATSIRFSAIGGGASFTAGVIRVTMHYISLSAPTS